MTLNKLTLEKFTWDQNGLRMETFVKDQPKITFISPYITVSARYKDAKTGQETIVISNANGMSTRESADILAPIHMTKLITKGFTIPPKNIQHISYALQLVRDTLAPIIIYSDIGAISTIDDQHLILLEETYVPSNYSGLKPSTSNPLRVAPKGSYDEWLKMFDSEVHGNHKLELATAIGISGLVNSFLSKLALSPLKTLMFHFVGDSSSGKTTSGMLALSTSGSPCNETHSLYRNWNSTNNSLINTLADNHGVPILFDEVSMTTTRSLSSTLYSITDGREKDRLNQDGTAKTVRTWNTAVISTGEHSILNTSVTSKNAGLNVRIIELNGTWTTSSINSDNIKKTVKHNYGHVLPIVAETLIANTYEDFEESYEIHKKWFTEELKKISDMSNTDTRMIDYYAVVAFSVELLGLVLERDLQIDKIKQLLIDYHYDTVSNRSMSDKAIDTINQFVLKNRGKFSTGSSLSNMMDNYGFVNVDNSNAFIKVDILKSVFDDLLHDDGYQDSGVIVNALDEAGFLADKESGRKTKRMQHTDESGKIKKLPFYSIKLDIGLKETLGLVEDKPESKPIPSVFKDFHNTQTIEETLDEEFKDF